MKKHKRPNRLEFGSKKKTMFSLSLLHSGSFKKGRRSSEAGRRMFNQELNIAKGKIKQYKINLKKKLPKRMKIKR